MKRNIDFNEISDGKRYTSDDLVKISCNECSGCSECCKVTDDTIHLDPYDIAMLTNKLNKPFSSLLSDGLISLTVIDGIITPFLSKKDDSSCYFLSSEGRCIIHDFRPGFCRLFPLGRIYNDDSSFDYFIQIHECPYPNKTKVKIKNWLSIPGLKKYEKYVSSYHKIIKETVNILSDSSDEIAKTVNMSFLDTFFVKPYSIDNFYDDFYNRISVFKHS